MADLSKLTNEELLALYNQPEQAPTQNTGEQDLSSLSDDELRALYANTPAPEPTVDDETASMEVQQMIRDQRPAKDITDYLASINRPIEPKFQEEINKYEEARLGGKNPFYKVESPDHLENFAASNASPLDAFLYQFAQKAGFESLDEATAYAMSRGWLPPEWVGGEYENVKNSNRSPDEIYNDYLESARTELRGAQNNQPVASTTGGIAGGVTSGVAQNAILPGSGLTGALRSGATSAAVGGLTGFGAGEENRVQSAIEGAALGAASDLGLRAVGTLVSPAVRPEVQNLIDRDVRLTTGQILGGPAQFVENTAGNLNLPLIGRGVNQAQRQAFQDTEQALVNTALAPSEQFLIDPVTRRARGALIDGEPVRGKIKLDPEEYGVDFGGGRVANRGTPLTEQAVQLAADRGADKHTLSALDRMTRAQEIATLDGRDVIQPRDVLEGRFPQGVTPAEARMLGPDTTALGSLARDADTVLGNNVPGRADGQIANAADTILTGLGTAGTMVTLGGNPAGVLVGSGRALYSPPGQAVSRALLTGRQQPVFRSIGDLIRQIAPSASRNTPDGSFDPNQ